jgi:RND family efflux transporter MFP subunit
MAFLPFSRLDPITGRRYLITGVTALIAFILAYSLWWHYLRSPWTRDGRVRAEVVNVASQVAGQVTELPIVDNQVVKKGDVLFVIDPIDYKLALDQAEATVKTRELDLTIAKQDAERRQKLGLEAVSTEERNTSTSNAEVADAAYKSAVATRDQAKVNLGRTTIVSPVNGYVTNLTLRIGDYATPGQVKLTVVDSDSYWIVGYFEETKLPQIHDNDYAHVRLMGWGPEIAGHVESISHAIADTNNNANANGLADVDPIFTWVRLAQRLPVRIKIDHVPESVKIAAGQTCTIVLDRKKKWEQ